MKSRRVLLIVAERTVFAHGAQALSNMSYLCPSTHASILCLLLRAFESRYEVARGAMNDKPKCAVICDAVALHSA